MNEATKKPQARNVASGLSTNAGVPQGREDDAEQPSRVANAITLGAVGLPPRDYERLARAYLAIAAPSAAPGEAASDEQCADHLDRLAALRLDSIGADAWQEAFARGASALRAAPAPVRVSEADEPDAGPWVLRAADRLALEVVKLTDSGRLGTRSPAGDALLDYAQARHGQHDAIPKVRALAAQEGSRG